MTDDDEDAEWRRRWAVEQSIALHRPGAGMERILRAARRFDAYAAGRKKAKVILIKQGKEKQ